jgi:UDP-N-acetylmuramate dehydrogenase
MSIPIKENIELSPYTTFKIGGPARFFCEVKDQFEALTAFEFAKSHNLPIFILGGGSNVLISDKGFDGLVVRVVNRGIEVMGEDNSQVLLRVASGENWDQVVSFAVKNNWWGLENLSHIPGSSGAIAVQNVGAYGQESKNVIESVTVFDTSTHQIINLTNADCGFSYRSSIFNSSQRGRYIIFYITFKLSKSANPILSYRDLKEKFKNLAEPALADIRQSVIEIRDRKFPFPTEAKKGNAGSFFKNLNLSEEKFKELRSKVSEMLGEEGALQLDAAVFRAADSIKCPPLFCWIFAVLKTWKWAAQQLMAISLWL